MLDDYTYLREHKPRPSGADLKSATNAGRMSPSDWALEQCSEIANILRDAETDVRVAHDEDVLPDRDAAERVRVDRSWRYLDARLETLATFQWAADHAARMGKMHSQLRHALGYSRDVQRIDRVPCLCGERKIAREGEEVWCEACGRRFSRHLWLIVLRHTARQQLMAARPATPEA
jgi:hypothetical protein